MESGNEHPREAATPTGARKQGNFECDSSNSADLVQEHARTLATNMTDFFRLLAEWDSAHRQKREGEPKDAR